MNKFRLSTVEISEKGIAELDEGRKTVFIKKDDIRGVVLKHGCIVQHPIIQMIFGVGILALGVLFIPLLLQVFEATSPVGGGIKFVALGLPVLLIGFWLVRDVFKRRFYLNVETEKKCKKIVFNDPVTPVELMNLVEIAHIEYDYKIELNISL
ncbi:hypothetical protein ACFL9T_19225 [Thermodesulfobacteriota bacterium]